MSKQPHYSFDVETLTLTENLGDQPTDKPGKEEHTAFINRKVWGPEDSYLTVGCQVNESNFNPGDKVKITIEKIK